MIFNYKRRDFLYKILFLVLITTVLLAFICSCTGRANTTSQTLIFNSESKEIVENFSEEIESLESVESNEETTLESDIEEISESEFETETVSQSVEESEYETWLESEISQESEFNQESEREQASESEVEVDSESTEESCPTSENELGSEFESEIESESIEDSITESEEIEVFVVTFQVDNGEEIENQFIEEGNLAVCPPIPTKNGYVFMGWYINDEIFDFSTPIEFNFELVARWEEIKPIGSLLGTWQGVAQENDGCTRTLIVLSNGTGTLSIYFDAVSYGVTYAIRDVTYYGNTVVISYEMDGVIRCVNFELIDERLICNDVVLGFNITWIKKYE